MDLKIIKEEDMPLMSRKKFDVHIEFKGATPSRLEIRNAVAAKAKAEEGLTVIRKVDNSYGNQTAQVEAYVYSSKEDMEKFENKILLGKHAEKKEEEKAE